MKRKILAIMMIIFMITILGTINSLAAGNIELNVQGETTVKDTEKTIELTLSLGSFTEIEEGIPLGYQGTLEYDENLLKLEEEFINDFIKLRKDKHLTQEELARRANVIRLTITRIENLVTSPQLDTLIKILEPIGYTVKIVPIKKKKNTED